MLSFLQTRAWVMAALAASTIISGGQGGDAPPPRQLNATLGANATTLIEYRVPEEPWPVLTRRARAGRVRAPTLAHAAPVGGVARRRRCDPNPQEDGQWHAFNDGRMLCNKGCDDDCVGGKNCDGGCDYLGGECDHSCGCVCACA